MPYVDTGRVSLFFAEAGSGEIPVLLLHELGGCSDSWREVMSLLAADRRVIAVPLISDVPAGQRNQSAPSSYPISQMTPRRCCEHWGSWTSWT